MVTIHDVPSLRGGVQLTPLSVSNPRFDLVCVTKYLRVPYIAHKQVSKRQWEQRAVAHRVRGPVMVDARRDLT